MLRASRARRGKEVTLYKIGEFTFDTQRQVLFTDDNAATT